MKFQESFTGLKADFGTYVKKIVPDLFANKLAVEGKTVAIPADAELDYKVKYDTDEAGGSFTLKVAWDNTVEAEDDEEEEL